MSWCFNFNSESDKQCASNMSDIEHHDEVTMNKVLQDKRSKNRDTVIKFNVSDSILIYTVYLISWGHIKIGSSSLHSFLTMFKD